MVSGPRSAREILGGLSPILAVQAEELRASGFFDDAARRLADAEATDKTRSAQADAAMLISCGVPAKHARHLTKVLTPALGARSTEAIRAVKSWLDGDDLMLLLLGPHGVGKTFAASLAVYRRRGIMVPARRLLRDHMWCAERRTTISRVGLLAIDDVGREATADAERTVEAIDEIVNVRCDAGLRTIVTGNLSLTRDVDHGIGTWADYIRGRGPTIATRLLEYGVTAEVAGGDLRAEEAAQRSARG